MNAMNAKMSIDETYIVELLDKAKKLPQLAGTPISDTPKSWYLSEAVNGYRVRAYNWNGLETVEVLSGKPLDFNKFWVMLINNASDELEPLIDKTDINTKERTGCVWSGENRPAIEMYNKKVYIHDGLGALIFDRYLNAPVEESTDFDHG